ncbi:MAG: hypothetical protein ACE5EV_02980, partial [Gaiellales bacterium]
MEEPVTVVTKVAPADQPLLAPLLLPGVELHWREAASTIAFRLDNRGDQRDIVIQDLGDGFTLADVNDWVRDAVRDCVGLHLGALSRADFSTDALAALAPG